MSRFTRRNLLASVGGAVSVGLAGCGYQPGGGELDWEERGPRTDRVFGGRREVHWLARDERLVAVRNRNSRTFDLEEERWVDVEDALVTAYGPRGETQWNGNTDDQHDGAPAISSAGVFVPIEDGSVTALYGEPANAGSETDEQAQLVVGEINWTNDRRGPPLDLEAGGDFLAGTHADGVVAFDGETGDELFAREFEALSIDSRIELAVGGGRVWIAGEGDEPTLYGFDAGGSERSVLPLPSAPVAIVATEAACVVALDDEFLAVGPDGERRWEVSVGRPGEPPLVADGRVYASSGDELIAIDLESGEVLWERESPFSATFVAGADRLCGIGHDGGTCRLVGLTDAGEDRWAVPAPDELDCSAELYLLDDRLVAIDDDRLYGFHAGPGRRQSIL